MEFENLAEKYETKNIRLSGKYDKATFKSIKIQRFYDNDVNLKILYKILLKQF